MVYVALLRGINVGGNNKVEMTRLKKTFEKLEFKDVRTYINSGNVVFSDSRTAKTLVPLIEQAIEKDFGFSIKVVIRDRGNIQAIVKTMPGTWVNDLSMKCDVMFLWDKFDSPGVIEQFKINPEFEDVKYVPGAIIWRVDRDFVTRSAMMKLVGTDLYKSMTIRNCNTVRKLANLMHDLES